MAYNPTNRSITDRGQQAGIPGQWQDAWTDPTRNLLTGSQPELLITDEKVPANVDWPALSVVTKDAATGVLALATKTTKATGILTTGVKTDARTTEKTGVYRAGCFNPDLLKWDASFATLEDKRMAFEGAATPTNIVIREIRGFSDAGFAP